MTIKLQKRDDTLVAHNMIEETRKKIESLVYPCIHQLLIIGCTLPVTSCKAERSFSSVRLVMNYLRSFMGEGRLAALTLINLHKTIEICP